MFYWLLETLSAKFSRPAKSDVSAAKNAEGLVNAPHPETREGH